MSQTWGISFFLLFLCLSALLLLLALSVAAAPPFFFSIAPTAVPALFIIGDSTVDVGTNDDIQSSIKANYPPYGIDFPGSVPTGRFSNGFNSADSLAKKLSFKRSPPPFLALVNQTTHLKRQIVHGVNFASAGSGLLDITGKDSGVITFGQQVQQFTTVRGNLTELLGARGADRFLNKSIILISVGSNDIFQEFFVNHSSRKQEFIDSLSFAYANYLKTLHSIGARKFGIVSVPAIGCCPFIRSSNDTGGCSEELNDFARTFYSAIEPMLQKLSCELEGMKYSLGNAYELMISFINNPPSAGITELKKACCGGGKFNAQEPCTKNATVCDNRKKYLFWDAFHPTEAAAQLAVEAFYNGPPGFVTPINFKQLAESC